MLEICALKTGVAYAAYLLLIGENGYAGSFRLIALKYRLKSCICANPVVLTVASHQSAIQTYVLSLERRNNLKLSRNEVVLHYSVFVKENRENIELDLLGYLIGIERTRAYQNVELLTLDALGKCSL